MTPVLQIERKPLAELVPAPYNPRAISPEALAGLRGSVERFGLVLRDARCGGRESAARHGSRDAAARVQERHRD